MYTHMYTHIHIYIYIYILLVVVLISISISTLIIIIMFIIIFPRLPIRGHQRRREDGRPGGGRALVLAACSLIRTR